LSDLIVKEKIENNKEKQEEFENEDFHVINYLNEHRINLNIRQVYIK
jgi:hypothetical protein